MLKIIGVSLLVVLLSVARAEDIPDFSANYLVKLNGLQAGELKRTLTTLENGQRKFTSISQAKGIFSIFKPDVVEESSTWRIHQGQIQPQLYRYDRSGGKKDKTLEITFDWQSKTAFIDDKKQPWHLKLKPKTLDKLIYQISLMKDLQQGAEHHSYAIADGGKLKTYHIQVLGEEEITTPLGVIKTVKLTRKRDKPKDRETTLWCAPSLNYIPVKLEHVEDDTVFTALLRRLKGIETDKAFNTSSTITTHTSSAIYD